MSVQPLNDIEREYLLTLARAVIEQAARGEKPLKTPAMPDSERLRAPGAAFVTLHTSSGQLRGCIGTLEAHCSLTEDVQHNAQASAFNDPRFPPVSSAELNNLVVEVSVLTPPEPLAFDGPDDLIRKLRPNVDGVLIERGWNRATFLPQVWEQLPDPEEFLGHLCNKARLPVNAWQWPDLKVSTYQVEKFTEQS
ncbi:MAG: AmmeMemoRadiSam system protein A [Anaerolineae bacterium]|nr:AmmeMemoRadiSam system protein A [Anaerolineae bacterium]